jgi:hypothetical protein
MLTVSHLPYTDVVSSANGAPRGYARFVTGPMNDNSSKQLNEPRCPTTKHILLPPGLEISSSYVKIQANTEHQP